MFAFSQFVTVMVTVMVTANLFELALITYAKSANKSAVESKSWRERRDVFSVLSHGLDSKATALLPALEFCRLTES